MNINRAKAINEIAGVGMDHLSGGRSDGRAFLELLWSNAHIDWSDKTQYPWGEDDDDAYIKYVRTLLGHTPINLPVAVAVVLDQHQRILLEQRSDNGKWTIPSGHLKIGESNREAAQRELREETGLDVALDDWRLLCEDSGSVHVYPNGDVICSVKTVYVANRYSGELISNHESTALGFFKLEELPDNVSGSTRRIVKELLLHYDNLRL